MAQSVIRGKYIPNLTNKIYTDDHLYPARNDTPLLNTPPSSAPRKVDTNINKVKQIDAKKSTNVKTTENIFCTKTKIIVVICIIVALLIIAAIVIGVVIGTRNNSSSNSTNSTNSSSTTTSTNSSAIPNPCTSGALWNTAGSSLLTTSLVSSFQPNGLYVDPNNTLYITDESNSCVWKLVYGATTATTVAGVCQSSSSAATRLYYPSGVYVDASGNIYVSDSYNHRLQKFPSGSTSGTTATTIAGISGSASSPLNYLYYPRFITVDSNETFVYIADQYNHRILRFSTTSTSGTNGVLVAGISSSAGNSNTTLYYPYGVYLSQNVTNDLFITNPNGYSVIRWTPLYGSGYFVAGVPGSSGQTPVLLNYPTDVKIDSYSNIYVCDQSNHRILLYCANSQTGITIAGTGVASSTSTQLNSPRGIALDSYLNLYVSDYGNNRLQKFAKL